MTGVIFNEPAGLKEKGRPNSKRASPIDVYLTRLFLDDTLIKHGIGYFKKSADIGAIDIIARCTESICCFHAGLVNTFHNVM